VKYSEAVEYAEKRKKELRAGGFENVVEVKFTDAYMEIRWAFVERYEDMVFVFAEHYPPFFQHVDETEWYKVKTPDGQVVSDVVFKSEIDESQ